MLVVMTMGIGSGVAAAAEWSATPSLGVKGEYNSNLILNTGDNQVLGYWIKPGVKFAGATETLNVEGETRADFVQYFGNQDREFINLYLPLRVSYRLDRHILGFEGGYTRDNTLIGELQQTGLVIGFTQRALWTAMPTWTVGITERLSWKSGYSFMDAQYPDGAQFGFVNYQVQGVNAGPTYNLTELDEVHLTGEYSLVRMPSIGLETTYYGAEAGWEHDFGNQVTGSISGGRRFLTSTQNLPAIPGILGILLGRSTDISVTSQETVWLYRGSLRKQFERTKIQIDGSREINPSGFGRLVRTDRVGGSLSHNISETLNGSLSGALYFVSGLTTTPSSRPLPNAAFLSITSSLSWNFAQWWSLGISYTYAERMINDYAERYNSNSMFIMLTYGGEKWSVSR